uniref:Sucrose:sucrose 1-fructosyltransferase n=1 Tax=Allium sativum TaxID=4682 RepID=A0A8T9ICF4_ALLSA|nr:sucrose:sucrose 1-fructosyltransferase [Allium sativum]
MGSRDIESSPALNAPLVQTNPSVKSSKLKVALLAISTSVLLLVATFFAVKYSVFESGTGLLKDDAPAAGEGYPWTNDMFEWQRPGYHFQPPNNFMADPNAAMYYKGWYHFFYQYNPNGANWDFRMSWAHAVSKDMIHWLHLPIAMVPDHWYDVMGVWSGSATTLPDGRIIIVYTGGTAELTQVQNLAVPADPSDPLLIEWKKSNSNPILMPPPGVGLHDFRDPFPVWYNESDSTWRMLIGSKDENHYGTVLIYITKDFETYTLLPEMLHKTKDTVGMLECVDLYPVATTGNQIGNGLEMQVGIGKGIKHVLKLSVEDKRHDYYTIGTLDLESFTWVPDDDTIDIGVGLIYDYGMFYASKSFYDQEKRRRILWGYVGEVDSTNDDIHKGWANIMNIPRTILFDVKTRSNLLFWPVEELDVLRTSSKELNGVVVEPGSTYHLDVGTATQLDIEAEFEINQEAVDAVVEADVTYDCSASDGAAHRGLLGPFGLLVLANEKMTEKTATYFYVSRTVDGGLQTHFCQDELRSSKANDITKRVVGHTVPVLPGETFSLRILVDHSIVESFAQKGRAVATSRVYPTEAIFDSTRIFLFNNATSATLTAKSVKIWHMNSTHNHPFPGFPFP